MYFGAAQEYGMVWVSARKEACFCVCVSGKGLGVECFRNQAGLRHLPIDFPWLDPLVTGLDLDLPWASRCYSCPRAR